MIRDTSVGGLLQRPHAILTTPGAGNRRGRILMGDPWMGEPAGVWVDTSTVASPTPKINVLNCSDWLPPAFGAWARTIVCVFACLITVGQASLPAAQPNLLEAGSGLAIQTRWAWSAPKAHRDDEVILAVVVEIPTTIHINPPKQWVSEAYLIPTELKVVRGSAELELGRVRYPQPVSVEMSLSGDTLRLAAYEGRVVVYLPVNVHRDASFGKEKLELSLTYQACNATQCWPPTTVSLSPVLEVVGDAEVIGPTAEPDLFTGFGAASSPPESSAFGGGGRAEVNSGGGGVAFDFFGFTFELNPAAWAGWLLLHGVAAVGGFLLNLTPCVLPVIPLKILSLSQLAGRRGRCLLLGVVMSGGVVAFWLGLAGAIAGVGGFTATNQLFQYPWFTILVGLIIAWMAVGMCGLFRVGLPRFIYQFNPSPESVPGAFGLGVMTAVLSTPCTAPLMGSAAAWAATQPAVMVLTTFAAIGSGMALPYLVLSAWPGLVSRVPRSGPGSILVKQLMGLMMLAAASYFVGVGLTGWLSRPGEPPSLIYWWFVLAWVAVGGVWLAVSGWRIWRAPLSRGLIAGVAVAVVVGCVWGGVKLTDRGVIEWVYYTPERWRAATEQGKVVVMDFTAEWCLNCKVLEGAVLGSPAVVEALGREDVVAMKVDLTGWDEAGQAKLKEAGRLTIPLLVVYGRDGREVFKSDAYTAQQVAEAVKRAESAGQPSGNERR